MEFPRHGFVVMKLDSKDKSLSLLRSVDAVEGRFLSRFPPAVIYNMETILLNLSITLQLAMRSVCPPSQSQQ